MFGNSKAGSPGPTRAWLRAKSDGSGCKKSGTDMADPRQTRLLTEAGLPGCAGSSAGNEASVHPQPDADRETSAQAKLCREVAAPVFRWVKAEAAAPGRERDRDKDGEPRQEVDKTKMKKATHEMPQASSDRAGCPELRDNKAKPTYPSSSTKTAKPAWPKERTGNEAPTMAGSGTGMTNPGQTEDLADNEKPRKAASTMDSAAVSLRLPEPAVEIETPS